MWIVGTLILLAVGIVLMLYKQIIQAQNHLDESWHAVETQVNGRHGLIHSLVNMIREHHRKEPKLFEGITKAYNQCIGASTLDQKGKAEAELSRQLIALLTLAEASQKFKADREFQKLKQELPTLEKRIEKAATSYNKAAREFNRRLQSPVYSLLVKQFGFQQEDFFNMEYASRSRVTSDQSPVISD